MFLPLYTEHPEGQLPAAEWPLANTFLIGITVLISLAVTLGSETFVSSLVLNRSDGQLSQLLSHAFLHKDLGHLLGNMIFLFAFGNALNMRLGNGGYLGLYVLTAGFGGLGWLVLGKGVGAVGASGAAMGVLGAALVLLPFARVTVGVWILLLAALVAALIFPPAVILVAIAYWVYTMHTWDGGPFSHFLGRLLGFRAVEIPTVWVALVLITLDAIAVGSNDGVAHWAHITGFLAGIVIASIANACGGVRGTEDSPTALEWLGVLDSLPAPAPVRAPVMDGFVGVLRTRRADPIDDFEAWRERLPEARRRSRERQRSGAYGV